MVTRRSGEEAKRESQKTFDIDIDSPDEGPIGLRLETSRNTAYACSIRPKMYGDVPARTRTLSLQGRYGDLSFIKLSRGPKS